MPRIIPRAATAALAALAIGAGVLTGCGDGQTVAVEPAPAAVPDVPTTPAGEAAHRERMAALPDDLAADCEAAGRTFDRLLADGDLDGAQFALEVMRGAGCP
jgi:hypothetical protein